MEQREKNVLIVTSANHFLAHFAMLFFPILVKPIDLDMPGIGQGDVLALSFPGYLAFGLTALPAGYLATRFKTQYLLAIGAALISIGAVLAGLLGNEENLSLFLLLIGVGAGIYHPVGLALVSNTIRKRGRGHGIQGVFGNIGIAAAPLVAGGTAYFFDWRTAYELLGAVAVLVCVLTLSIRVNESTVEPMAKVQKEVGASQGKRIILFGVLALSMMLAGFVYRGFHILLPTHLVDGLFIPQGIGNESAVLWAAISTTAVLTLAAFGQLLGGRLADRISLVMGLLIFHALSFPMLLGFSYVEGYFLPFFAGWFAFFNLGMQPFENSLVARYVPAHLRSLGYGLKFILSFGVGSLAVLYAGGQAGSGAEGGVSAFLPFLVGVVALVGLLGVLERAFDQREGS